MFTRSRLSVLFAYDKKFVKCRLPLQHQYFSSKHKLPIASGYKPKDVESEILANPDPHMSSVKTGNQRTFRMILPPPNVTGHLHLGHALMSTVQDVICRRKRQEGYQVTWVPGTDHAGIATQVVVEKKLFKEKQLTRHQIGREAFLGEVAKWKREKEDTIKCDLKRLGCTLNWEQEYFTMDEKRSKAVTEAFVRLFDSGIIQRKHRLVNWSCILESAISDIEVDTCEINGPTGINVPGYDKPVMFGEIHDIVYKIKGTNQAITVSTTRPETILGDVAIAVHPDDLRYSEFKVKPTFVIHPFRNDLLPVVFDASVDREFGTGAVKITPAHDKNDFELAHRHSLPSVKVFTEKGVIADDFHAYAKQPRFVARHNIVQALKEKGLYQGSKPHKMQLPICSRSNDVIEYMLRPQWFVDCTDMAGKAMEAVRNGQIKIHPSNFEHDWFRWLEDCKEWCISRQIWWGHRIPAYFCETDKTTAWVAAHSSEEARKKAEEALNVNSQQITKITQDVDVLDTWFSSSLLPLSAFDWPTKSCQPLDLMETGHDILFFWVARMVMMGMKLTGHVPFINILLNGIVCDVHGRKMSKSLGNVILPEQIISGATVGQLTTEIQKSYNIGTLSKSEMEKSIRGLKQTFPQGIPVCGTDALRFTLCSYNTKSHYINFDTSECHINKLFFNKIWQATRFVLNAAEKQGLDIGVVDIGGVKLSEFDRWILSRLGKTKKICDESFESYNFHFAVNALKSFFYRNLCDVYLETTKPNIADGNDAGQSHCFVLSICLSLGLQIMSPFTPFLSQKLFQYLPTVLDFEYDKYVDNSLEAEIEDVLDICSAIRQFKSQNKISKKHEPVVHLYPKNDNACQLLDKYRNYIQTLCLANIILEKSTENKLKSSFSLMSTASHLCTFALETNQCVDPNSKSDTVNVKKLEKLQASLQKLLNTISSDGYKKSASESIQRRHLEKIKEIESEIGSIRSLK